MAENTLYINREIRRRTDYIFITHSSNLIIKDHIPSAKLIKGSNSYSWGEWERYLYSWGNKKKLPMHYFMELIDKDYAAIKGLAENRPSYYIDEQIASAVIKAKYRNSILIVLGDDYDLRIPSSRLYEQLSEKIIVPLMKLYNLDWSRVVTFDECITDMFFESVGNNYELSRFEYKPMRNFDMTILRNQIAKFNR